MWVDNLKAFGIAVVILGHISSPFGEFIYSWHMPLFFVLGGFFIRVELGIKEFFVKDFKRLMIPYFVFALIAILLESFKRLLLNRESLDYSYELLSVFVWMDMSSLKNTYAFVLWFLPALWLSRLMVYMFRKHIEIRYLQFLIVACLFSLSFYFNSPLALDNALNAVLFVYLGNIIYNANLSYRMLTTPLLLLMLLLIVLIYTYAGVPLLDVASKSYQSIPINILWSILIVCFLISVFKRLGVVNDTLRLWGRNTLFLFIIHPYTNNISHIFVEKIQFGGWFFKISISLLILHVLLIIRNRFEGKGIFKYV
ncbi:acyltransferase family protein [Halomonas alkalisoli]|uniref:acyltransferase family protein n=1 Tax=Halomonas alkalisoli TaxID=2907158 RepID=UPI001F38C2E2|nr:acyltransferase family protein [Halomonas alkalisoli]